MKTQSKYMMKLLFCIVTMVILADYLTYFISGATYLDSWQRIIIFLGYTLIGLLIAKPFIAIFKVKQNRLLVLIGCLVISSVMTFVLKDIFIKEVVEQKIIEIIALGDKQEASSGTEVWLVGLVNQDQLVDLQELPLTEGWEYREGNLLSYQDQPNELKIKVNTGEATTSLNFLKHAYSGKVKIVDGQEETIVDLYDAQSDYYQYNVTKESTQKLINNSILRFIEVVYLLTIILFIGIYKLKKKTKLNSNHGAKSRSSGIDLIKTIAIIFVIAVHFFLNTEFYTVPFQGINMFGQGLLRWLFMACVPLFILATGYLQCGKQVNHQYFKGIIGVLRTYLIYSILALIALSYFNHEVFTLKSGIEAVFLFSANRYSWYVNMYIGLFLLIPFLNKIHEGITDRKQYQLLIGILIFMAAMPKTLKYFPTWWIGIWPLIYYFIGAYIRKYTPHIHKGMGGLGVIILVFIQNLFSFYASKGQVFVDVTGDYASFLVVIQATLLFLMLYKVNIQNRFIKGMLALISSLTLEIYLGSFIIDTYFYPKFKAQYFVGQENVIQYIVPVVGLIIGMSLIIGVFYRKVIKLI